MRIYDKVEQQKAQRQRGALLMDLLIGTGLGSVILTLVSLLTVYSARSFQAMTNYVDLDQTSRNALDKMSREIRQTTKLLASATNYLSFQDFDGGTLVYTYDPVAQTLTRTKNGVADSRPLLTKCYYLNFSIYQRNTITNTYNQYPTATAATCKLVQLDWVCSRPIIGTGKNTESVQSAKVVIRRE